MMPEVDTVICMEASAGGRTAEGGASALVKALALSELARVDLVLGQHRQRLL
ncbi:MAG: hypothetical protein GXY82_09850 [Methanospirillum sp.]|nr:hypothetical protein [Methanospirillum sp.]